MRPLVLVLGAVGACAPDAIPLPATGDRTVETFASALLDDDLVLYIRTPPDADPDARYPLVLQLDPTFTGARQYDHTVGLISDREADGTWPPAVVVGLDYDDPFKRFRDYTPTLPLSEDFSNPDGADRFYAALRDEVLPHLTETLPVDPSFRVVQGHSNGGSFAWYAALRHRDGAPPLFAAHVAADSGIPQWMFTMERWHAEQATDLPIRLFATRAADNGALQAAPFDELLRRLGTRDYPNLAVDTRVLDTDHGGAMLPSYAAGLAFAFEEAP